MSLPRITRLAHVVLATSLVAIGLVSTAVPASAYIDDLGPDLAISTTSTPGGQVQSGAPLSYTLTVTNTAMTWKECVESPYPGKPPKCITYRAGGPVSNVVVRDVLPAGAVFQSASGNSGFWCSAAGGTVTCSGGALAATATAQIVIHALAPTLPAGQNQVLTNTAEVNPSQAINERTYANNASNLQITGVAPGIIRDLVVTSLTGPSSAPAGSQVTYTITVANAGNVTISDISTLLDGGNSQFNIASSNGTAGFAPCYSSPERFSLRAWCPGFGYGSLAPGSSATINVTVQLPGGTGNHTMSATVDPYNRVQENNEGNNQRTLSLNVF